MDVCALHPYEAFLRDGSSGSLSLGGTAPEIELDVERWLQPADDVDLAALGGLQPPVLDIGCGPGRIVEALTLSGTMSLGIDIAATAVALARGRGLNALRRDVFGPLPLEGRWSSAVLLDGNIGIGGEPRRLLSRVAQVVRPGGSLLVETDPHPGTDTASFVRFWLDRQPVGPAFRWAIVGPNAVRRYAEECGLGVLDVWSQGGRSFVLLETADRTSSGRSGLGNDLSHDCDICRP